MKQPPKRRRVTLSDVARLAGVNRVTVSVALGRSPQGGTRVSEATRQRILAAARELGYVPNAIARALRNDRTHIIGYYAGYEALDARSPFTAAVLQGLQRSCRRHNQDLLLFGSFERDTADSIYATLADGKIDGLVLLPTPQSPVMDWLFNSHLPVVAITNFHPAVPSVVVDDVQGSQLLARYLAHKGHRRILYRANAQQHVSSRRRQEAFCQAAAELGMTVRIIREGPHHSLTREERLLLQEAPEERPTAAVCWMDLSAYALIAYCENAGLQVPEDLAVVGFDGVPLPVRPARSLTTIRAPWADVAALAVEHLLALLDGQEVPPETILPVELVVGDTA